MQGLCFHWRKQKCWVPFSLSRAEKSITLFVVNGSQAAQFHRALASIQQEVQRCLTDLSEAAELRTYVVHPTCTREDGRKVFMQQSNKACLQFALYFASIGTKHIIDTIVAAHHATPGMAPPAAGRTDVSHYLLPAPYFLHAESSQLQEDYLANAKSSVSVEGTARMRSRFDESINCDKHSLSIYRRSLEDLVAIGALLRLPEEEDDTHPFVFEKIDSEQLTCRWFSTSPIELQNQFVPGWMISAFFAAIVAIVPHTRSETGKMTLTKEADGIRFDLTAPANADGRATFIVHCGVR